MSSSKDAVRKVLDAVKADKRTSLTAPEGKLVCDAYGIPVPKEGVAKSAGEAATIATGMGFPVVMKIVSPDILHKTEAGGVIVGVKNAADVEANYATILANAKKYKADARIEGIQVQQMLLGGQEVIVGAVTDGSFGKLVAFGLGGVLVEVLKDITFRLAPATKQDALSMLEGIQAHEMLKGVRGNDPVNRDAIADIIVNVSKLITDFPEITEMDLNPVFATKKDAIAADVRIVVDFAPKPPRPRSNHDDIVRQMNRIMKPKSVAVIGASAESGKIGNSVMKNLINGGYKGEIYPIHPKAEEILGKKVYKSVKDIPDEVDIAVFAIPASLVTGALVECGEKKVVGAILIPSGYAETGNVKGQEEIQAIGRKYGIRLMGPNIYGFYYTHANLCATFCTAYDVKGSAALSSQSGGIGMAIIGFSRSARMGVSAIVGLGNKADLDEDDLLTFFEQDNNTRVIAQHCEDLKDGRSFAEVAKRVSKKKPIIVLKAGRTAAGSKAASSHTGALAGDDRIYEDVFNQCGVIRARSLRDMLEFARGVPILPTPKGENVVVITGAGGSGVLLSDACIDNKLSLMAIPPDLDVAFRKFIPPFGAAGNPIDITGGEPPITYVNTVKLGLEDPRIHSLILGYWHTIVTPPMVFAKNMVEIKNAMKAKGIEKPIVASLAGDVEVEEAADYLYQNGIVAYAYSTEIPVAVLGAKYKWARGAGLL
ncbi:MAG: acetate--CoA ligase family protein [Bradyrhizobium sp.]|uniref:acetate--CoA ligase family protein n=1 Tax=Bradyrhizobium sp. TaxID=376 RepID=UPI001C28216F|nr:acetate--CoA ligase family protein [Bradyrhizobium sp.]MBU6463189.1 acetate--CoA ligase family protein [Pseudomonadota bacterium]MDE2066995.1 acetate--CoA ligase family protein [Bradyrhizobium sp.]MDE2241196.1 acetate--CoA ligase family protein [Bradyrhizobium sp.]MDE2470924.1 acetate--CoA ligase family protein [Bradyrhizobium sp.]